MASNSSTINDGLGSASDWIEIYNPSNTSLDLSGWHLTDSSSNPTKWTFPTTIVGANEYLVVFASNKATTGFIDPLGYRHTTFALSGGGEYLGLTDPNGVVVSEFAPTFPPQTADISYGLDNTGSEVFFAHATPGAANDSLSALTPSVVVSEIMYHPSSELSEHEFLELLNTTNATIDLTGWQLDGAVEFVFPAITLAPGEYLAVASNPTAFATLYPSVTNVVGGWSGRLSNSGESITLLSSAGSLVDTVTYSDQGDWATRDLGPLDHNHRGWVWSDAHDGNGSSLELVSSSLSNNFGQNWAASTIAGGTPGAANSVRDVDNNAAPLILETSHYPIIPSSTDPVVVTARLVDELATGVTGAVFWRVDGAISFQMLVMADDGLAADSVAGDFVYTAQLPAMPSGTIVEYYVQAGDQLGNLRTFPSPTEPTSDQLTNLLFQVDDSFDPNSLPSPGDRPIYRLIMTEAERSELAQIGSSSSDRLSHARMNGTLVTVSSSGIELRYRIGVRNRGESSSTELPNSYHVDIPRDNLWHGLEAFNLNTQFTHSQLAGLKLFAATGEVAEDGQAVGVRVNGVDLSYPGSPSYGVYVQLEAADGVFVTNHYGDDDGGNLYKAVRSPSGSARADFRDLGSDPASYAVYYEKQTNKTEVDFSDIMELVQVLNYEPDATFIDRVSQIVNIDQWVNYFATFAILGSEESSLATGVGDDFMLYRGEDDPRFELLPHDFDTILGRGDTSGSPTGGIYRAAELPVVARFLLHPAILPTYHARLAELLATTFAKDSFDAILDTYLADFAPAAQIDGMKAFMDERRDYILDLVTQPLSAVAPLISQGGYPRAAQDNVALLGTAPLANTQSVTVNGLPAVYDTQSGQWHIGEATGEVTNLINTGHVWKYLTPGQTPSTAVGADWRSDNLNWSNSGPSQLGYGDTQATVVPYVDTDPGQSGTQKNITTYFQSTFNVTNAAEYTSLTMELLRDDGAVVYLNGVEVVRSNMPSGEITSTTLAPDVVSGSEEETFFEYSIDPTLLVEGQNVIAVEIHQDSSSSSDIGFDLHLSGVVGNPSSTGGVPLTPGINRLEVKAFDAPNGTGNAIASTWVDVWFDNGVTQNVSGTINTPQHWTATGGPYVVTGDIIITGSGVLTIDPGTTVFFSGGTGISVTNGGQLLAQGTVESRIRFAPNPSQGGPQWDGLAFTNTLSDSRLSFIDLEGGGSTNQALYINHGRLAIDHATWLNVNVQIFDLEHPTLTVRNSLIPGISGNETVHLFGLNQGEQLEFENNVFGKNTSGNDVIDLGHDTLTPATIIFRGNTFLGGYDDGVDTDGFPVLFENNTFSGFHLNTSRNTTSNAVSTGYMSVSGQAISSQLTLVGNVFFDNDHHMLLKDRSFATLTNNTMVKSDFSAIHLEEPGGTSVLGPGRGASIDGTLFWDNPITIEGIVSTTELTIDRSIVPTNLTSYGSGNLALDPLLANAPAGDLSLTQRSPALNAGPAGSDIGAIQVPDYTPASAANLRITEIHYDPLVGNKTTGEIGGTGKSFEFIELANTSNETIDLSGVTFDEGVEFAFPWLSTLGPGETVLITSNEDLFLSRYGDTLNVAGQFSGNLSGDGERVRVRDAAGLIIADVTYGITNPWPNVSGGYSLEIVEPLGNPAAASNWRSSTNLGGSPGSLLTPPALPGDYNRDLVVDSLDYQVWKSQFGTTVTAGYGADGNLDGVVSLADYTVWRDNLGATSIPANAPAVTAGPEPVAPMQISPAGEVVTSSGDNSLPSARSESRLAVSLAGLVPDDDVDPVRSSHKATELAFASYAQENTQLLLGARTRDRSRSPHESNGKVSADRKEPAAHEGDDTLGAFLGHHRLRNFSH